MTNNQEKFQFGAEVGKILQLMIHSLYTNKDIFLRELISNASDACDKLRYESLTKPELLQEDSEFNIRILPITLDRTLTISDNGIGMNKDDLVTHLGTIAKSGTQAYKLYESDYENHTVENPQNGCLCLRNENQSQIRISKRICTAS